MSRLRSNRVDDARLSQSFGVSDGQVLDATVGMVDEPGKLLASRVDGHLEGIESEVRAKRCGHSPADDPAAEDVDDERGVVEAGLLVRSRAGTEKT